MTYRESFWTRIFWFLFQTPFVYVPIFAVLLACFVPTILESSRIADEERRLELEQVSYLPPAQLYAATQQWLDDHQTAVKDGLTLDSVFSLVDRANLLELQLTKEELLHGRLRNKNTEFFLRADGRLNAIRMLAQGTLIREATLLSRKGGKNLEQELALWRANHPFPTRPKLHSETSRLFAVGFFRSILVMLVFLSVRVQRMGLAPWVEAWRIIPAALFWPLAIFIYPHRVDPRRSLKRALEFVCYTNSVIVGVLGGVGSIAKLKAQEKPSSSPKSTPVKKSSGRRAVVNGFTGGTEIYPVTSGPDKGMLVSPWYAFTTRLGTSACFNHFGFVEVGKQKSQFFTNNAISVLDTRAPWLELRTEIGGSAQNSFAHLGPRVVVTKIPEVGNVTSKALSSLEVGYYGRIRGPSNLKDEWVFSWTAKSVAVKFGAIQLDGFYRYRPGQITDVGQPRLVFLPPKTKHVQFVTETWLIGPTVTWRFGLELLF